MYLVLLLGAGFELLGRVAGLAVLLEAGEQLALADRLQIQIPVVVLAENVRAPYYLPRYWLPLTLCLMPIDDE